MTQNDNMAETVKISVPSIIDDPLVGRCSSPLSLTGDYEYIIIEDGMLKYTCSTTSRPKKLFKLNEITKLLLVKKKVSCWTTDHKLDPWARIGTEIEVSVVDVDGKRHELVPAVLLNFGKNEWDRFIQKLCKLSGLPLEKVKES